MVRRFVFVMMLAVAAGSAVAAEVNVYPAESLWTGGTYYIPSWPYWGFWWENPITWGNFFWMTTPCSERGFARFDLSGLPDYITVSSAVLRYHVYYDTGGPGNEIRLLNVEPFPDSEAQAEEVYHAIGTGTLVASLGFSDTGWVAVPLDSPAWRAIEERTLTTDWLGLGWVNRDTQFYDVMADGWGRDSFVPYVTVTYELTGLEQSERAAAREVRFAIAPNPVTSGRVAIRLPPSACRQAPVTVSVLDASGRAALQPASWNLKSAIALDLRGLRPGVYMVRLSADRFTATQKLVVQH
jgi:hypothetical protein